MTIFDNEFTNHAQIFTIGWWFFQEVRIIQDEDDDLFRLVIDISRGPLGEEDNLLNKMMILWIR